MTVYLVAAAVSLTAAAILYLTVSFVAGSTALSVFVAAVYGAIRTARRARASKHTSESLNVQGNLPDPRGFFEPIIIQVNALSLSTMTFLGIIGGVAGVGVILLLEAKGVIFNFWYYPVGGLVSGIFCIGILDLTSSYYRISPRELGILHFVPFTWKRSALDVYTITPSQIKLDDQNNTIIVSNDGRQFVVRLNRAVHPEKLREAILLGARSTADVPELPRDKLLG